MSEPLFNFRLSRQEQRALEKAAIQLATDKSSLARAALRNFLRELQQERLISAAPTTGGGLLKKRQDRGGYGNG